MIALRVQNLCKSYRITHQVNGAVGRYRTLREDLVDIPKRLLSRLGSSAPAGASNGTSEEFHALRDISFEVQQGEVLGIIGRNGAGKSTLLKILSRITEPTSGSVQVFGRVASLLEVGTGFHPELTGRENIFLNGAILGMRRSEIARKFDEIVDFAEVEKFLDTPVKRYSSGMYVRLAFAVAAHLEPEILIVDEVLAVGDAQFQKKCLGKMEDVSRGGRTVLLVSHSSQAILSLCSSTLLFDRGTLIKAGDPRTVMNHYLGMTPQGYYQRQVKPGQIDRDIIDAAWLQSPLDLAAQPLSTVRDGCEVELVVSVTLQTGSSSYVIASFWDDLKRPLWEIVGGDYSLPSDVPSQIRIRMTLPAMAIGSFSVDLALGSNHAFQDHVVNAIICTVESDSEYLGGGQRFPFKVKASFQVSSQTALLKA